MKNQIAKHLLEIGAVSLQPNDPFTWSSGLKSPIYCDNRLTMSYPAVRKDIAKGLQNTIKEHFPTVEVIAGTATGGIAPAAWVSDVMELPMCYVRGAAKSHGKGKQVEGAVKPGQKVVVIEDLISTGGSSLATVEALRAMGCEVLGIAAIFSYELDASKKRLSDLEVDAFSVTTFTALAEVAAAEGKISNQDLEKLEKWRQNPQDESWVTA
ncbi:orotate phosphoribosyltransferase [Bacillus mesophilus]|uniref:Orotate phosphoribosyltransferase n=1 Tax=Bacillus mesophilus TaxID=1808955 RepID=A0A6M0Q1Z1_9BACI|nr:orotate phosphoribosyltransferase [Bacillus mesophilus]MBM7659424.1 orotate phosphoribosyltransferase [Bacillus mesophilus]NEY70297.1 orotate phosphoribosyltransferase [Bacillus mesophilus]